MEALQRDVKLEEHQKKKLVIGNNSAMIFKLSMHGFFILLSYKLFYIISPENQILHYRTVVLQDII